MQRPRESCPLLSKPSSRERLLSVGYRQTSNSRSHLERTPLTKCDIVSSLPHVRVFTRWSPCCQQPQFSFWDGKPGKAAIQADQKFWEYPDAGFVQILEAAEMDDHLSR